MPSLATRHARWAPDERAEDSACAPGTVPPPLTGAAPKSAPGAPRNPRLAELAEQVRRLCARGTAALPRCPSGLAALDAALGGGFARGATHELLAPREGPAARSVALMTAARAAGEHRWIVYLDTSADFYPPGAAQLGVPLERLVVVRVLRQSDALWVCEQTLRCTSVAAVVVPLPWLDTYASRRLQLAAETGRSLGLFIIGDAAGPARNRGAGRHTFAASRVRFEPLLGRPPVRCLKVTVLKLREGQPREPLVLELPAEEWTLPPRFVASSSAAQGTGAAG